MEFSSQHLAISIPYKFSAGRRASKEKGNERLNDSSREIDNIAIPRRDAALDSGAESLKRIITRVARLIHEPLGFVPVSGQELFLFPILDKKATGWRISWDIGGGGGRERKVETLDGGSSRQKLRHRRQFPSLSNRMNYTVAASSSLWTGRLDNRINENAPPPPPLPPSTPEFIRYYRYVLDNSTFIAGRWKSYLWAVCQYLIADRRFSRRASP